MFTFTLKKEKPTTLKEAQKKPVKVRIVRNKKPLRILETKQTKTEAPTNARYAGITTHKAKKEQIVRKRPTPTLGDAAQKTRQGTATKQKPKLQISKKKPKKKAFDQKSLVKKQNSSVFSKALAMAREQNMQTFQETVDEDLPEGEILDLSTNDYRYIGYFIRLRKEISLNWVYPLVAARRGQQGKVYVLFSIERDGKVSYIKVLESSGHTLLDEAVIATLKDSSPFAPLPENYTEKRMNIRGYFNYIL